MERHGLLLVKSSRRDAADAEIRAKKSYFIFALRKILE